jgi:hypothetical protein
MVTSSLRARMTATTRQPLYLDDAFTASEAIGRPARRPPLRATVQEDHIHRFPSAWPGRSESTK